jgi:hypothetical protein
MPKDRGENSTRWSKGDACPNSLKPDAQEQIREPGRRLILAGSVAVAGLVGHSSFERVLAEEGDEHRRAHFIQDLSGNITPA